MNCIELKHVNKSFGEVKVARDVSLTFEQGKIYGLLGRNGAGKSTLLNMITGRVFPDDGTITVNGEQALENDAALSQIYLMSENNFYPETMKVKDAFKWSAAFYPAFDMANALALAEKFGLNIRKKMKELSTGYNSIFKLAVAMSVNTPYVLLDEPVLGLDANHRDLFYRLLLEQYEARPACYVISTHLIEEAAGLIEDVVIIKSGEIICNQSCETLLSQGYTVTGAQTAVDSFAAGKQIIGEDVLGGMKSVYILGKLDTSAAPEGVTVSKLDLQKLFIQLTNA